MCTTLTLLCAQAGACKFKLFVSDECQSPYLWIYLWILSLTCSIDSSIDRSFWTKRKEQRKSGEGKKRCICYSTVSVVATETN